MANAVRVFVLGNTTVSSEDGARRVTLHFSAIEAIDSGATEEEMKGAQQAAANIGHVVRNVRMKHMDMPPDDVAVIFAKIGGFVFSATIMDPSTTPEQRAYVDGVPPQVMLDGLMRQMTAPSEDELLLVLTDGKVRMERAPRELITAESKKYERVPPP
jgi:hypothetical protein